MDNAELAIGIDLGTTNSLIAVWKDGAAQLIPNKFGEYLTPSIISMDENNHILVGKPAVSRRTSHPDKTAALFKRAMGSNTNWRLGSDTFNAPELSSLVLRSLKEDAEEFLQRPIKDVVISVPAYFSDEQRKHTRLAAELAGLNAVRLINEPTAAAMAYGLHTQQNTRSLVFDLGGGTFDVTVLEYATPVIEVHASAGDNFLGGEDFTHMLVDEVLKRADVARTTLNESELEPCTPVWKRQNVAINRHCTFAGSTRMKRGSANFTRTNWKICGCRCSIACECRLNRRCAMHV